MGRFTVFAAWQSRSGWLALAAGLTLATAAMAQAPEGPPADAAPSPDGSEPEAAKPAEPIVITPPEVPFTRARVVHRPSMQEVNDLYPDAAARQNMGGKATVICGVAATQRLVNCVVTREDPPGYGFGAALLKMVTLYRVEPPTYDGKVVQDFRFEIPMTFTMAAAPRSAGGGEVEEATFTPAAPVDPPEETPEQRLKRLGPLRRSDGVLWAPVGFALLTLAGVVWGLWPVRRGRRVHRPADQRA
jgi:TonB family protein